MTLRKELQKFAELQEKILKLNDHKRLFIALKREVEELERALINGAKVCVRHECADVANFAMMIADNNGG